MNLALRLISISEIAADSYGRMCVRTEPPSSDFFNQIYRAGRDVWWNNNSQSIMGPDPTCRSLYQAFKEIVNAAQDEGGIALSVSPDTRWVNIPPDTRTQIEEWSLRPIYDANIIEALETRGYSSSE